MQESGLNCERDEYPPAGFWQDQDIHDQWIRMLPKKQNGPAGAALFGLGICGYNGQGEPPSSTRNARFDRIIHGPNRDTEVYTADVTTTLYTVSIRFDRYPNQPDFGLTENPCWPSTLVDDPGFALLTSDAWYHIASNDQRHMTVELYALAPSPGVTQNKPPRLGYQKRSLDPVDTSDTFEEGNIIHKLVETCNPLMGLSAPRESEAEPTAADSDLVPTATPRVPMVGGGAQLALGSMPKSTGAIESYR